MQTLRLEVLKDEAVKYLIAAADLYRAVMANDFHGLLAALGDGRNLVEVMSHTMQALTVAAEATEKNAKVLAENARGFRLVRYGDNHYTILTDQAQVYITDDDPLWIVEVGAHFGPIVETRLMEGLWDVPRFS